MAEPQTTSYQRLPGTGYRRTIPIWAIAILFFVIFILALLLRGRRVRLWLGEDHLLSLEWDGYREYYKRFRYEDIQMLSVRRTVDGMVLNILFGAVCVFFVLISLFGSDNDAERITWFVPAAIFGLLLLANFLRGPTCTCMLQTAVQVEEMPSLGRLRVARNALPLIRARIEAVQGALLPDALAAHLANPLDVPPVITHQPGGLSYIRQTVHYESKIFPIFCWILVGVILPSLLDIFIPHDDAIMGIKIIWMFATIGFAITSLVRQQDTDLPRLLRWLPWIAIGGIVGNLILSTVLESWDRPSATFFTDPVVAIQDTLKLAFFVGLGVFGLMKYRQFRTAHAARAATPPATPAAPEAAPSAMETPIPPPSTEPPPSV